MTTTNQAIAQDPSMNRTRFHVIERNGNFPQSIITAPYTEGYHKAALRIGGGCGQADQTAVDQVKEYIVEAFAGINCLVASGGTLDVREEFDAEKQRTIYVENKFMVTGIPVLLLEAGYKVIPMSTTPRTGQMELGRDYGETILGGKYRLDYRQADAVLWQVQGEEINPDQVDWVGDVPAWLNVQEAWKNNGVHTGWWGIEGGGGTRTEVLLTLERGIPVILTANSGRQSDVMCKEFSEGKLMVRNRLTGEQEPVDPSLVTVVDYLNASQLNAALRKLNLIA